MQAYSVECLDGTDDAGDAVGKRKPGDQGCCTECKGWGLSCACCRELLRADTNHRRNRGRRRHHQLHGPRHAVRDEPCRPTHDHALRTWPGPTSTVMPPTPSRPTSPG